MDLTVSRAGHDNSRGQGRARSIPRDAITVRWAMQEPADWREAVTPRWSGPFHLGHDGLKIMLEPATGFARQGLLEVNVVKNDPTRRHDD